jgi:glycosyltransferase involved in cell wall biosynthesis
MGENAMKKKLLMVTNTFNSGGIGKYIQKILPNLTKSYEVSIVSRDEIDQKDLKRYNISESYCLKSNKLLNFWPVKEISFYLKGKSFLKNKEFDLIIENYPFFVSKSQRRKSKVVSVFHASHKQYAFARTTMRPILWMLKLAHFFMIPLDYLRIKQADKVIFVSQAGKKMFKTEKSVFIPNPIEKDITWKKKTFGKSVNIIFVARNDPFKGTDFLKKILNLALIENPKKYENLEFYLAGLDNLKIKHERLHQLGKLSFKETEKIFMKADIFLNLSYLENAPNVLFEALEFNVLPLVSDVGDCSTILGGENELIFESANLNDFLQKFDNLIENGSVISSKLERQIKVINKSYEIDNVNKRLLEVIR